MTTAATTRDRVEVLAFDAALILTGIYTLPASAALASAVATGWRAHLVQALLLFCLRAAARYVWRRYFRGLDK